LSGDLADNPFRTAKESVLVIDCDCNVARRCGYRSVDVLRKAFVRRMGVSPKEYAQRFAPVNEPA
jgi:transcriptional regulator GlxA family with amidase domain